MGVPSTKEATTPCLVIAPGGGSQGVNSTRRDMISEVDESTNSMHTTPQISAPSLSTSGGTGGAGDLTYRRLMEHIARLPAPPEYLSIPARRERIRLNVCAWQTHVERSSPTEGGDSLDPPSIRDSLMGEEEAWEDVSLSPPRLLPSWGPARHCSQPPTVCLTQTDLVEMDMEDDTNAPIPLHTSREHSQHERDPRDARMGASGGLTASHTWSGAMASKGHPTPTSRISTPPISPPNTHHMTPTSTRRKTQRQGANTVQVCPLPSAEETKAPSSLPSHSSGAAGVPDVVVLPTHQRSSPFSINSVMRARSYSTFGSPSVQSPMQHRHPQQRQRRCSVASRPIATVSLVEPRSSGSPPLPTSISGRPFRPSRGLCASPTESDLRPAGASVVVETSGTWQMNERCFLRPLRAA